MPKFTSKPFSTRSNARRAARGHAEFHGIMETAYTFTELPKGQFVFSVNMPATEKAEPVAKQQAKPAKPSKATSDVTDVPLAELLGDDLRKPAKAPAKPAKPAATPQEPPVEVKSPARVALPTYARGVHEISTEALQERQRVEAMVARGKDPWAGMAPDCAENHRKLARGEATFSGKAATPKRSSTAAKPAVEPRTLREGSAGARLVDAVLDRKGATHAELCALLGWKQCLPMALKSWAQAGVVLRKEKEGRGVRYFGTPASAAATKSQVK
jgi:hypothetical protein